MSADPSLYTKKIIKKLSFLRQNNQPLSRQIKASKKVNQDTTIIKYLKVFESQLGLLLIVGFSLIMNLSIASAKNVQEATNTGTLTGMTPEAIADTATAVSKYIPNISTDNDKIKYAMAMQSDANFVSTFDQFDTNLTPPDPEPVPVQPAPRTKTVNYTVASGDTLSTIGAKFGLSVATLQATNNLSNADTLKIDQILKIPSANLSASALAKAKNSSKNKTLAYARNTTARDNSGNDTFIVPVSNHGISQRFYGRHHGIDYMTYVGTNVRASSGGTVIEAKSFGWNYGWGKNVLISHGGGVTTRYAHLSQVNVSVGDQVGQGEIIGKSGNTGNSTGPHLHFQKEKNGTPIYPY